MRTRPFLRQVSLKREKVPCFDRYPFDIPAVNGLDFLDFHEKVTFFVGENGMGKSTLMEALAVICECCPEGGGRNFRLETCATHSPLWQYLRAVKGPLPPRDTYFLRAESFYNVATYIDELDSVPACSPPLSESYGGSLHTCSHGESFFALLNNRLSGDGLYLFDEPEAALSPMRQMSMLTRIHQLARQGCQLIISTHSPILLAYPDSIIYHLGEDGIQKVAYEDTEHFAVTKAFLNQYPRMLRDLLQGDAADD